MNTLPLQQWVIAFRWEHNGNLMDKKISKQEATRANLNGAIIRIGRDQASCNLHLEDSSVSGQHAEIYFNEQQQKFFIKSLQLKNITNVDGQDLSYGKELPLQENSTIVLGQQKIVVNNIQIYQVQGTNYSGIASSNSSSNSNPANPNPNPTPVNSNPSPIPANPNPNSTPVNLTPNSTPFNLNVNLRNVDQKPDSNKPKHWLQEPTVQAAIIAGLVGIVGALLTLYSSIKNQELETYKTEQQLRIDQEKFKTTFNAEEKKKYQDRLLAHRDKVLALRKENGNVYNKLKLINKCFLPVSIAASFTALDDVLEVRGWLVIEPQGDVSPGYFTNYSAIHLHALIYKKDENLGKNKKIIWTGDGIRLVKRYVVERDFTYIEDPRFDENDKPEQVNFYRLNYDKNNDNYTTKTFTCDGDSLQLN